MTYTHKGHHKVKQGLRVKQYIPSPVSAMSKVCAKAAKPLKCKQCSYGNIQGEKEDDDYSTKQNSMI